MGDGMKFYIFTIWERFYKKIIVLLILAITYWCFMWYLGLEDKSNVFVISILYALFLFTLGIYINYMENIIDGKFYERKDYYINLSRLKAIFENMNLKNCSDKDMFLNIIHLKTFTSRNEGMENIPPHVKEKGFKYNYKELEIEDNFINKRSELIERLNSNILEYIEENQIEKKYNYPHVSDIFFDVKEWCNNSCTLKKDEIENMESHIYNVFSEMQSEIDELKLLKQKVKRKYLFYKKRIEWNFSMIENKYGKRLEYEFYKEDKYFNELIKIKLLIKEANENLCTYDNYVELESYMEEFKRDIFRFGERIELLEDNLKIEIDSAKNSLF